MKILLASTSEENFSGASKCLIELASSLIKRKHKVVVSIPKYNGMIESDLNNYNIPFIVIREYQCWYKSKNEHPSFGNINLKRILNEISVIRCREYLRSEKFDIIHVNALTAYVVGKAAIIENIPVVWHMREFMEEDLGITFVNRRRSLNLLNMATQFVSISNVVRDKWIEYIKKPINVVYDGVPIDNYYISQKKDHSTVNILLYGRIVPGKGQLFYIKAANAVLNKVNTDCKFYFAGKVEDVNYYRQCIEFISENNKKNDIQYIGEIQDIKSIFEIIDIVCVCSLMEGFGRVTVESMLGKCLVIGADSGATAEIIRNKESGLLYQADNFDDFCEKLTYEIGRAHV